MATKILLIEDDIFIRDLYERALTKGGFELTVATDGMQGFELAKQDFQLILLDIMLPKINGIELLKKLKTDPNTKKTPIILLTNLGQESIIKEAFEIGASGYLMKMRLTPNQLIEQVQSFIKNPNQKMDFRNLDLD